LYGLSEGGTRTVVKKRLERKRGFFRVGLRREFQ